MKPHYVGLVGDVGGTNARFALVDPQGHVRNPRTYAASDYASLDAVIADYLDATVGRRRLACAVIAVAGPVLDGEIEFTNLDWQISEGELLAAFEFDAVKLINDFAAQALACPRLSGDDLHPIGPKLRATPEGPLVVLGAGTGFGVAGLARSERGDVAIASEGGHASFAPSDEIEAQVWSRLKARFGRVSIERMLSGPGLYSIYSALADIQGVAAVLTHERELMEAARRGDPLADETLNRFCGILGTVAGDLALTYGALGGVFISGGIAPRMVERLDASQFRARFEDKGRMRAYLEKIPVSLVLHPYPAMTGAARLLAMMERA